MGFVAAEPRGVRGHRSSARVKRIRTCVLRRGIRREGLVATQDTPPRGAIGPGTLRGTLFRVRRSSRRMTRRDLSMTTEGRPYCNRNNQIYNWPQPGFCDEISHRRLGIWIRRGPRLIYVLLVALGRRENAFLVTTETDHACRFRVGRMIRVQRGLVTKKYLS